MATEKGYNPAKMLNPESSKTGALMLDKLSRCGDGRRVQPLNMHEYITYPHRNSVTQYNLRIGDCLFIVPPEFIMVTTESQTDQMVTIRQESTQHEKHGHHKKIVLIDLVFSSIEQINGYKVPAPKHKNSDFVQSEVYYVDGLRQLLAQFKCAPFLPVTNEYLNLMHGITVVALQSITISTVNGFPNVLKAQITLQEAEMFPYLDAPNVCFREMIDWDLFRYYYQSFLTERHRYKRLQSIPENHRADRFKISILNPNIFDSDEAKKASIIDICSDTKVFGENGTNYVTYIDSNTMDVDIEQFECGYSNILTNIQLSMMSMPTVQYIGGMDTIFNIKFRTKDKSIISSLQQCQIDNDVLIRLNPDIQSCLGFVKLESELVEFMGSLFVMIDSITTATVPGFPDLYTVQINCVSYDITQSEREHINGFRPFDDTLHTGTEIDQKKVYSGQTISNSTMGILRKTLQDMYAEEKFMKMELYPDLRLPKYAEVDEMITNINAFRSANGLTKLPYDKYPRDPICGIHGQNALRMKTDGGEAPVGCGIITFLNSKGSNNVALPTHIKGLQQYEGFVDPDFYVFYPLTYEALYKNASEKPATPAKRNGYSETIFGKMYNSITNKINSAKNGTTTDGNIYSGSYSGSTMAEKFINVCKSKVGYPYVYGTMGPDSWDCSGLISWALGQVGATKGSRYTAQFSGGSIGQCASKDTDPFVTIKLYPTTYKNTTSGLPKASEITSDFDTVIKVGDIILCRYGTSKEGNKGPCHVVAYCGDGYVVHAKGSKYGIVYEKAVDASLGGIYGIYRPRKFIEEYESAAQMVEEGKSKETTTDNTTTDNTTTTDSTDSGKGITIKLNDPNLSLDSSTLFSEKHTIMESEYNKFAACVMKLSEGRDSCTEAFAQMLFDIYTSGSVSTVDSIVNLFGVSDKYTQETSLLNVDTTFDESTIVTDTTEKVAGKLKEYQELSQKARNACDKVFTGGKKVFENRIFRYTTADSGNDYETYKSLYTIISNIDGVTFWGQTEKSKNIVFSITKPSEDSAAISFGDGSLSRKTFGSIYGSRDQSFGSDTFTEYDIKYAFGEPVLINVNYAWNNMSEFNENTNLQMLSSFSDQYHYSKRCRLVRAFPTYLISFIDEDGTWYDGRKLWSNYYTHRACVDIQTHAAYDMPTETATVTITDTVHALDQSDYGVRTEYNFMNDDEVSSFGKWLYKHVGLSFGLVGAKLTSSMIKLNQVISVNKKLRENARVHIRIGYGSDPGSLATVMNGVVTELSVNNDQISMIVTSDGNELISNVVSADEDDVNDGVFSLFGLGATDEPSNIIADIICQRENNFINDIASHWFEMSKFGIEHYGTFRSKGGANPSVSIYEDGVYERATVKEDGSVDMSVSSDWEADDSWAVGGGVLGTIGGGALLVATVASGPIGWIFAGLGTIASAVAGSAIGRTIGETFNDTNENLNTGSTLADLWNQHKEQFDIMINIYKSDYKGYLYTEGEFLNLDGEDNVVFNRYNMTPWDIFQTCAQNCPEYIVKSTYFQFDSRLFFGLPFFFERTRYFLCNTNGSSKVNFVDNLWSEMKPASQVHYITNSDGIIDNQMRVTGKHTYTNVKVMYLRGGDGASTLPIHSDDTIDPSRQNTKLIDTSISQDVPGHDFLWEWLGLYDVGDDSAMRFGVSELLYGWQQQYQGQIICTGQPGIKPQDHLLLSDAYSNINGMCLVREINHSFSVNTGFTTSITPGMIAINSGENNSGMSSYVANYLAIFQMMAQYSLYRTEIYTEYEYCSSSFTNLYCSDDNLKTIYDKNQSLDFFNASTTALSAISAVSGTAGTITGTLAIFAAVKNAGGIGKALVGATNTVMMNVASITSAIKNGYTVAKEANGIISGVFLGIGAANGAWRLNGGILVYSGTAEYVMSLAEATQALEIANDAKGLGNIAKTGLTLGKGLLKCAKVQIVLLLISVALNGIIKYISNKHRIWLVPLWKDEQPFATRIKNGENILLFGNQSTDYGDD